MPRVSEQHIFCLVVRAEVAEGRGSFEWVLVVGISHMVLHFMSSVDPWYRGAVSGRLSEKNCH